MPTKFRPPRDGAKFADFIKVIRYSWSLKRFYLTIAGLVVVTSLLAQSDPFLVKFIIDGLTRIGTADAVGIGYYASIIGAIFGVGVLTALISNVQGYIGDRLGARLNTFLSQRYYDHVLGLPLSYYDNEVAGRVSSRLERSIVTVSQLMTTLANNFIGMLLTVVVSLGVIAWFAWPVALLLILLFPFYVWLTALSSKRWQTYQEKINHETDANNGRFVEALGQVRVVKSFAQELAEGRLFARRRHTIENETRQQSLGWHKYDVYRRLGLAVVFAAIYGYITWQAALGALSISDVVLLLQLVTTAQWPLYSASFFIDALQRAQAGSKDYFDVMETEPEVRDAAGAPELTLSKARVVFDDVRFGYQQDNEVLRGISFTVEPGQKIALVGESGEGKTTITNLLLRFYNLSGGRILIDGEDIMSVTQASPRRQIGVVFQEPALFSGSIRDNITYGTPDATDADVERAATAANAAGFITKLPNGYDSEIGERGVKLSGGQKQRLAIARAILKDAPILILDEATSSLDSKAEHEVQAALEELMKNRTTIIIAHRLSTIASVDKIIGLRGGQVLEAGTPKELASAGGIYSELLSLQSGTSSAKQVLKRYDIAR